MVWPVMNRWGYELAPWSEFRRLQQDMDRLLGGVTAPASAFPAVSLWSNDNEAVLRAELPGVDPASLSVSVNRDVVTLSGERKPDAPQDAVIHREERPVGAFSRSFRLPFEIEAGKVEAKAERGVIRVKLPRREATKPRKIAITAE